MAPKAQSEAKNKTPNLRYLQVHLDTEHTSLALSVALHFYWPSTQINEESAIREPKREYPQQDFMRNCFGKNLTRKDAAIVPANGSCVIGVNK